MNKQNEPRHDLHIVHEEALIPKPGMGEKDWNRYALEDFPEMINPNIYFKK